MRRIMMLLIICIFTLTGCSFKDVEKRLFIVAIGIDIGDSEDEIRITLKAAIPGGDQAGESGVIGINRERNYELHSGTGESIGSILRKLKTEMALEPDYTHMKILLIGKEYARQNSINDIIDYFTRRQDIPNITWVALGLPSAKAILDIAPLGEASAGSHLFLKFGQGVEAQHIHRMKLHEYFTDINTPGVSPSCPVIEIEEGNLLINKAAVFDQGKLALLLSTEETKVFNMLYRELETGFFQIIEDGTLLGLEIIKSRSKTRTMYTKDKLPLYEIDIKLKTILEETDSIQEDFSSLERRFERNLSLRAEQLLQTFQEENVDPLGIGVKYWASDLNYELTEEWNRELYQRIRFNVKTSMDIVHTDVLK
jgi:spore germination protein KC